MRLQKYLKVNANLTQTALIELFESKKILVNGIIKSLSSIVSDSDIITIDGKEVKPIDLKYYKYYKPRGVLSDISDKENSYNNVLNLDIKLMPVGRLDKESEGLLILTNDSKLIDEYLNPLTHVEKRYLVYVKNIITNDFIKRLSDIKELEGKPLKPFKIENNDNSSFFITLSEGKYHQIRKMVKMAYNEVVMLKRISVGKYTLGDMKPGDLIEIEN